MCRSPARPSLRHCRSVAFATEPRCTWSCKNPILAQHIRAVGAVWIYGRVAAERPACERKEPLWWGWQDAAWPLSHGLRAPEDILCIDAEADWILAEEQETVLLEYAEDLRACYARCPLVPSWTRLNDLLDAMAGTAASDQPPIPKAAHMRGRRRPKAGAIDHLADNPSDSPQAPRRWQW